MVKNTIKLSIITLLLILPFGTPEDFVMIPAIIAAIGLEAYIIIVAVLSIYLYNSTKGKTLGDKLREVKKEIQQLF